METLGWVFINRVFIRIPLGIDLGYGAFGSGYQEWAKGGTTFQESSWVEYL
jgi:hypothetical protein